MDKDQARQIEQDHNVYVDADTEMYTNGEKDDYGWMPIPEAWKVAQG